MEDIVKLIILGVLCIVIVLLLIPSIWQSNGTWEAAAISKLRTIASAEELYRSEYGKYGVPASLRHVKFYSDYEELQKFFKAIVEHKPFCKYFYSINLGMNGDSWSATAVPEKPGKTGGRSFFIDETGEIRAEVCESESDPVANKKSLTLDELSRRQAWEIELKNR